MVIMSIIKQKTSFLVCVMLLLACILAYPESPKQVNRCSYFPLAVGNRWFDPNPPVENPFDLEVSAQSTINGYTVYTLESAKGGFIGGYETFFLVTVNDWCYIALNQSDFAQLPTISPGMIKFLPEMLVDGQTFTIECSGGSMSYTIHFDGDSKVFIEEESSRYGFVLQHQKGIVGLSEGGSITRPCTASIVGGVCPEPLVNRIDELGRYRKITHRGR